MDTFELSLVTTEACNLSCKYCYMINRPKKITPSLFDKIYNNLNIILTRFDKQFYRTVFFGGEPLLNWELITHVVPIVYNDPRCNFIMIISNGLELDNEKIQFIKNNNIAFSLSFDGLWNDENRPLKSGGSSFEKYIEKKDLIKTIAGGCKCMISPGVIKTMTENFEFFVEDYGFPTPSFTLVRDNIWTKEDIEIYKTEITRLCDRNIKYIKDGIFAVCGLFTLPLQDIMAGKYYGKRPFSCYAGSIGMGFSPDGYAYPCARFSAHKKYPLYNIETGVFDEENMKRFDLQYEANRPDGKQICKGCDLFKYCNTGCKFTEITSNNGEPLSNVCELFDITYKESIRLLEELKDQRLFTNYIKQITSRS